MLLHTDYSCMQKRTMQLLRVTKLQEIRGAKNNKTELFSSSKRDLLLNKGFTEVFK